MRALAVAIALADCLACGGRTVSVNEPEAGETPWCLRVAVDYGSGVETVLGCFVTERRCEGARRDAVASADRIRWLTPFELVAVGACWEADVQPEPVP